MAANKGTIRKNPLFNKTGRDTETSESLGLQTSSGPRVQKTVYLSPENVVAIRRLQIQTFEQTGKEPEISEIVNQALTRYYSQMTQETAS